MYNATVLAQKKLSTKLSEANAYIRIQEDRMKHHDEDMMAASEIFRKVCVCVCVCTWAIAKRL